MTSRAIFVPAQSGSILKNGSRDGQPIPRSGGVSAGSGGGRESNPPATRSAARRF
jgi:hypothetical protein